MKIESSIRNRFQNLSKMKKLIQNNPSILTKVAASMLTMFFLLGFTKTSIAQVDCNLTMACNDGVQVSLDENCEAEIFPDMLLENMQYTNDEYTVIIMDAAGNIVPTTVLDYTHVNQSFSVNVQLNGCAAACWGNISIEDKLPPVITCDTITAACDSDLEPGSPGISYPTVSDACDSDIDLDYFDEVVSNPCAEEFVKTVTRTWVATDVSGNSASCTQLVQVMRANIEDVTFPPNYDDIEQPSFSCNATLDVLDNGAPSPMVTGFPSGASCPNIQTHYEDVVFDICGASKKILRQWIVIDWCTGEEVYHNQIIKIIDDAPPICVAPADFIFDITTDQGECTGTFEVPAPIVAFECSDWNYIVGYKLRAEGEDPFTEILYENISLNPATGLYTITDLPQDTSWIVYTLTDDCGNSTQCFTEVYVNDDESPTPVCEGYTVVGLEDAGWADIFATSIDDGSFDNCELVKYEVRRTSSPCGISSDLTFGEKVNFCCEDVASGPVSVVMRVYDAAGNFNDCVVNVTVQDKIDPVISCPANISLQCTEDYTNLSLTGQATGSDNCSLEITYSDNENIGECGLGTVRRTWIATDPQGRTATCTQFIYLIDSDPFSGSDINWPSDMTLTDCDAITASPEELGSFPVISNEDCANIAVSYDDVFYNTPDFCVKVLRHWRVVDWCNYDPQNPEFYQYTQKLEFVNNVAPVFDNCSSINLESTGCQADVNITVTATDDCTPSLQLDYSYAIDQDSNGSTDLTGNSNTINRTLPAGIHTVTWTAEDACDNSVSCTQTITIIDTKKPTPICLGEVTWVLDSDGQAEIWASDFNLKSEAACGSDDDLTSSFNSAGNQQVLSFTCADVPNGIAEEISLQMYVIDASGNFEYCDVTLILQDSGNTNACNDQVGMKPTVAGRIFNAENEGLVNIDVELMNMDVQEADMNSTNEEGVYAFQDVDFYGAYAVEPFKNDDVTNGVSTLDLVLIQRHILGLDVIENPYQIIAADIDANDKVSASDLLNLRKVILGITTDFKDNTSWRFIPTAFTFEEDASPFDFPEKVEFSELYLSDEDVDFTAIKVGDINGNATVGLTEDQATVRTGKKILEIENISFNASEKISIPVLAGEVDDIVGMQFAVKIGSDLKVESIVSGQLTITTENYYIVDNELVFSWNDINAVNVTNGEALFTIEAIAQKDGDLTKAILLDDQINAEIYDASFQEYDMGIEIDARSSQHEIQTTHLYQNTPNPFEGMTAIGFDLKKEGMTTLAIFDVAGKELYRITNVFPEGYSEITVDVRSIGASSGILFYTLSSGDFIATKKMIILE